MLELESKVKEGPEGLVNYYALREQRLNDYKHGQVNIHIKHRLMAVGGELIITVKDSGTGFDFQKITQSRGEESHGRGLSLVERLSESMTFTDNGRCIEVIYRYQKD